MPLKRKRSFNKKNRSNKKNKRKKSKKKSKRLRRTSSCNRSRKVYRKRKKSKRGYRRVQMGCAKRRGSKRRGSKRRGVRQMGGAANYNCEYPNNMGEIVTGTKNNLQGADLIPHTTQNRLPSLALEQKGGGLIGFGGLGTGKLINLGLSHPLTTVRNSINYLSDIKNTWDADRQEASADPIIAHKMDNS
jgi:hypothetical protein